MKYCYLCGIPLIRKINRSKDHAPPDCIFPPGTQNMITIPCCITCNKKYENLDERMRNYIATLSGKTSFEPVKKAQKAILRSPKLIKQYLSYTKNHPILIGKDGKPRLVFYFNKQELNLWFSRLVKGIYFHKNGKRINDKTVFKVEAHPEIYPPPSVSFPMENGLERRPYFIYGVVKDKKAPNTEFWGFVFYDHLFFSVIVELP